MKKEIANKSKVKHPLVQVITWIVIIGLIIIITGRTCKAQQVYGSISIDPIVKVWGPRIDISHRRINTMISYNIGKPWFNTPESFQKVLFESSQLGFGYTFGRKYGNRKLLWDRLSPYIFISYNRIDWKYYNISYGVSLLTELYGFLVLSMNSDIKLWTHKIGLGVKLCKCK